MAGRPSRSDVVELLSEWVSYNAGGKHCNEVTVLKDLGIDTPEELAALSKLLSAALQGRGYTSAAGGPSLTADTTIGGIADWVESDMGWVGKDPAAVSPIDEVAVALSRMLRKNVGKAAKLKVAGIDRDFMYAAVAKWLTYWFWGLGWKSDKREMPTSVIRTIAETDGTAKQIASWLCKYFWL